MHPKLYKGKVVLMPEARKSNDSKLIRHVISKIKKQIELSTAQIKELVEARKDVEPERSEEMKILQAVVNTELSVLPHLKGSAEKELRELIWRAYDCLKGKGR